MINYKVYTSFKELPDCWDAFVFHDVFLQSNYIQALQQASPNNIQWFYLGVFDADVLVGIAIIQRVQLYLKDMFRQTKVSCVKSFFQDLVSKVLKGNVLVVGNLTHTGQHGLFFNQDKISQPQFLEAILSALSDIEKMIKTNQNKKIRVIMFKDYFENDSIHLQQTIFDSLKLHKVTAQPNMMLFIRPEWINIDNYIENLNKKYRDRYKRARKKLSALHTVELNMETIQAESKTLYMFYRNVSNNAKFNTFLLPENHFYSLKYHLKENFKVYGYYLNDKLIGFYSLILNNENLETYFLGYDEAYQYTNQLYLNMLYDMLMFGIYNRFKTVVYARTAMEIKSSIGAEAKPMLVYMKHTTPFLNSILKQLFKLMNPMQDWEERHPFK